jgi:hypothetical protein
VLLFGAELVVLVICFTFCWFAVFDALSWFCYLTGFYGSCSNSIVCFAWEQSWSFWLFTLLGFLQAVGFQDL